MMLLGETYHSYLIPLIMGDYSVPNSDSPLRTCSDRRIVGHQDHRLAFFDIKPLEFREDFGTRCGIEVASWLVGKQDLRPIDQGSRNGDALLLAAGKLVGLVVGAVRETDAAQEIERPGPALTPANASIDKRQFDIVECGLPFDQVETLKNEAELAIAQMGQRSATKSAHVLAGKSITTARRLVEETEHVHQGRFARSTGADDRGELARLDG